MRNRYFAIAALLMLFSSPAAAVELGDIAVSSHLGTPFRAAVPLSLAADEAVSKLTVELATPNDYQTLNVHRDPAINAISAKLAAGPRGNRIELSSRYPLKAPYFTLVLKVQYRRATHFKRYTVTLDSPRALRSAKRAAATPTVVVRQAERLEAQPQAAPMNRTGVDESDTDQTGTEQPDSVQAEKDQTAAVETVAPLPPFKPFDGWARTARYGPSVRGDMLRVIADRLRIDERYTISQVMVALYEKNRSNFVEENLNLPTPGSYFDVPTAAEVEKLTHEQAAEVVAEHGRRWRELKKQPRYAAIAEAQKNRYRK